MVSVHRVRESLVIHKCWLGVWTDV